MTIAHLEELRALGVRVKLNDRGDGMVAGPPERRTDAVNARLAELKPALLATLLVERDARPDTAAVLRSLGRLGVTISRGRAPGKFKVSDPSKVPADLVAAVKSLAGPLDVRLLLREVWADEEMRWRAEPMRRQIRRWQTAHPGDEATGLPFLVARPLRDGEWHRFDRCFSCGDALANDPGWDGAAKYHEPYFAEFLRCSDCRAAVRKVQEESGGLECRCFCGGTVHRFTVGGDPLCEAHAQPVCLTCLKRPSVPGRWLVAPGSVDRYRLCPFCTAEGNHRVEVRGEERAA